MSEKLGEPWTIRFDGMVIDSFGNPRAFNTNPLVVSRIAACVNSFAGIEDPEAWVKAHRELVEAVSAYCDYYGDDDVKFGELLGNMQTALASCKAARTHKAKGH